MKGRIIDTCFNDSGRLVRVTDEVCFSVGDLTESEYMKVQVNGENTVLEKRYVVATEPETVEDIAFLDKLSKELQGHKKICFLDGYGRANHGYVMDGEDYEAVKGDYENFQNRRLMFELMKKIAQEEGMGVYHAKKSGDSIFSLVRETKGRQHKTIAKARNYDQLLPTFRREVCTKIKVD